MRMSLQYQDMLDMEKERSQMVYSNVMTLGGAKLY